MKIDLQDGNVVWVYLDLDRDWWWAVVDYGLWSIWLCFSRGPKRYVTWCHVKDVQCTVYVRDTSIQITATGLPCVGLCRVLAPSDFHLFDPLKKQLGSHILRSDTESARSCLAMVVFPKHRVLCWKHVVSDNTLWRMREHPLWLCGKVGRWSPFSRGMLFWTKICRITKYSLFILFRTNLVQVISLQIKTAILCVSGVSLYPGLGKEE